MMAPMLPDHPLVRALGWALLHFVWQGALLAALAAVAMRLLRGRSAQARYLVGCGALLLMLLAALVTAILAYEPASALTAAGPLPAGAAEREAVFARLAAVARQLQPDADWRGRVEAALPSLVAVWLLGTGVLSVRLVGGWGYAHRLTRREVRAADPEWQRRLDALAARLGVRRAVRLLESARVRVPTLVGWLRPVVLLPVAACTGLTPRQLEAVLLHELAHVRRHDYLVNLVQCAVEVLLFYHPATWWLSARVREEREACCDDVAVAACGDALVYARALTELEGLRAAPPRLALAADGGSLLHRVRRLLVPAPQPARGPAPLLLGVLLLATFAAGAATQRALAGPAEPAAPAAAAHLLPPAAAASPAGEAAPAAAAAVAPEPEAAPESAALEGPDAALVARLRRLAAEGGAGEDRLRRLVEAAPEVTRSAAALDAYLDAAASLPTTAAQRRALSAVLGGSPAARPARAPLPVRERPAPPADTSLGARLNRAVALPSDSERRAALSALLREQAQQPR